MGKKHIISFESANEPLSFSKLLNLPQSDVYLPFSLLSLPFPVCRAISL